MPEIGQPITTILGLFGALLTILLYFIVASGSMSGGNGICSCGEPIEQGGDWCGECIGGAR